MRSIPAVLLILGSLLPLPAQQVVRVGALGAIPAIFDPIKAKLEKDHGIRLVYSEMGAADGWTALAEGKLDLAVMATSMEGWVELMAARGVKVKPAYAYRHAIVGTDELSILINPDVLDDAAMLAADLDRPTLKRIFTGAIRTWKEVGGPDLPVVVVGWKKLQVTAREFREQALDNEAYRADQTILTCETIGEYLDTLGKTKGAIGLGPLAITRSSKIWSPVQAPKLVRPFTLLLPDQQPPAMAKAVATILASIPKTK
jgi:ABC-type phosphate transport system substrate-binding protein